MKYLLYTLLALNTLCAQAQPDTGRFVQQGYFSFNYANDFFNATDRYFTQGIRIEVAHRVFQKSPLSYVLLKQGRSSQNTYGLAIEQQCYTPASIRRDTVYTGERPYAAVMFLSSFNISVQPAKAQRLSTRLDLGAIGPCAVCEQEQKGLHKWLDNIQPLGWEFQVANDVVINYNVLFEKGLWLKRGFELLGTGGFRAGTFNTDASLGLGLRTGWLNNYFNRPDFNRANAKFHGFLYLDGNVRAVAYNATLQGGLFSESIYTLSPSAISRLVGTANGGIGLGYKKFNLRYGRTFITPEFKNGRDHGWGYFNVSFLF